MSTKKIASSENIFGMNLRAVRKQLKLTQEEFAKPIGITGAYISDLEKGKATASESVLLLMELFYRINRKKPNRPLETSK